MLKVDAFTFFKNNLDKAVTYDKGSFCANLIEQSLGHSFLRANVYSFADITHFHILIYFLYYIYLPGVRII